MANLREDEEIHPVVGGVAAVERGYTVSVDDAGNILLEYKNKKPKAISMPVGSIEEVVAAINESNDVSLCLKIDDWTTLARAKPTLPESIVRTVVDLKCLQSLDMTGVQLPKDTLDSNLEFCGLTNLKTLVLDDTNLRLLHPTIGQLQELCTLSLQYNRLYDLPVTIRLLRNLKHLKITGNLFRSIPGAVYHLQNLETIEGLNENMLERYPGWKEGKVPIATVPPLAKPNPPRDFVDSLINLSKCNAVAMNIWAIPLPEHFRNEIVSLTVRHDLCENCFTPVKKIMADQETNGYMIKVCMTEFKQYRTVPFMFLTCSVECQEVVVERLNKLLLRKKINQKLVEVVLKEEYLKPVRIKRNQTLSESGGHTVNQSQESSSKCVIS